MEKEEKMFGLVALWRSSGLNKLEFCQRNNLKIGMFNYWIAKKNKQVQQKTGNFILLESHDSFDTAFEITYPNGVKLQLRNASLNVLAQLINL